MRGAAGSSADSGGTPRPPAELEVQRQLGITDKAQIEKMGIGEFNEACRGIGAHLYRGVARSTSPGRRWVDFDNDYKTLDLTFTWSR